MEFRVFALVFASSLLAGLAPAAAQILPIPQSWQLERAVLVVRHGVYAPVEAPGDLDKRVAMPWPSWPATPGALTQRGAELMREMGGYYRALYGELGLIEADICPATGSVAAWSDVDERTRASAQALLTGLYPRCKLVSHAQADLATPDPLFNPQPSASCPMDPASNKTAILARIGGDFSSVLREYRPQLTAVQTILCPPALSGGLAQCGLSAAVPSIEARPDGRLEMKGPIAIGANAAEAFLMERAQGLPTGQVAWGRLSGDAALTNVLEIRRLRVDLMDKTMPVAQQKGSNLLSQIAATLQDGHNFPAEPPIREPVRLALLVAHDSNIANIAGLLNLAWTIPGLQPNDPSPGGALAFELLRSRRSGEHQVRLAYYAQTLDQLRQATRLDLAHPPGMVAVSLPGCSDPAQGGACTLQRFTALVSSKVEPGCVTVKSGGKTFK
jgi:4-phytase / acid phosphatase